MSKSELVRFNKKRGDADPAFGVFSGYTQATMDLIDQGLERFAQRNITNYTELLQSLDELRKGAITGRVPTRVSNATCYLMQCMLIALDRIREHEKPGGGLDNRYFDPAFAIHLSPQEIDQILKENSMAAQIMILNAKAKEQDVIEAESREIPQIGLKDDDSSKSVKRLIRRAQAAADKPLEPDKVDDHGIIGTGYDKNDEVPF